MKSIAILLLSFFAMSLAKGQEAIVAAGGESSGSGGTSSYSVGQIIYTAETGSNGSVSQGIQQPYEIFAVSEAENNLIAIGISVFPNPTSDFLRINIEDFQSEDLQYTLQDLQGKQLKNGQVTSSETKVEMTELASSTYILVITNNQQMVKTFKIIKNQ